MQTDDSSNRDAIPRSRLNPGETIGFYDVVESSDQRIKLAVSSTMAIVMIALGALVLMLDVWLFKTGLLRRMQQWPHWIQAVIGAFPLLGVAFTVMLGRSFVFDATPRGQSDSGTGGPLIRWRWLWLFGKSVDARRVKAIRVRLVDAPSSSAKDRVYLHLVSPDGAELLALGDAPASDKSALVLLVAALHLSNLLRMPVHVEGEPKDMPEPTKDALEAVRRVASRG